MEHLSHVRWPGAGIFTSPKFNMEPEQWGLEDNFPMQWNLAFFEFHHRFRECTFLTIDFPDH
jgi:hypothetical protein